MINDYKYSNISVLMCYYGGKSIPILRVPTCQYGSIQDSVRPSGLHLSNIPVVQLDQLLYSVDAPLDLHLVILQEGDIHLDHLGVDKSLTIRMDLPIHQPERIHNHRLIALSHNLPQQADHLLILSNDVFIYVTLAGSWP